MILQQTSDLAETFNEDISIEDRTYQEERFLNQVYQQIVRRYLDLEKSDLINQTRLGERIGKSDALVSRALGQYHNHTLKTVSNYAEGLNCKIEISFVPKEQCDESHRNDPGPSWLYAEKGNGEIPSISPEEDHHKSDGHRYDIEFEMIAAE